jgi:hypothetical protein
MTRLIENLSHHLFVEHEGLDVYSILDGASVPDLLDQLYGLQPEFECLYRGELKPDLAEVAPYLVHLRRETEFTRWLLEKGWGNHWGILALSQADLRTMRRHFRTFMMVHDPDGKPLYFRYYDPRVLRIYLPTCNAEELGIVFGPVQCYLLENDTPGQVLRLKAVAGVLKQEALLLEGG